VPEIARIAPDRAASRRRPSERRDAPIPAVIGPRGDRRAPRLDALQAGGRRFDPGWLHCTNAPLPRGFSFRRPAAPPSRTSPAGAASAIACPFTAASSAGSAPCCVRHVRPPTLRLQRPRLDRESCAIVVRHYRRPSTVAVVARALASSPRQVTRAFAEAGESRLQRLPARRAAPQRRRVAGTPAAHRAAGRAARRLPPAGALRQGRPVPLRRDTRGVPRPRLAGPATTKRARSPHPPSFAVVRSNRRTGGANDIDGSALAAQPGKSQGPPLKARAPCAHRPNGLPSLRSPEGPRSGRPNCWTSPPPFEEQLHAPEERPRPSFARAA
jgi:AraC-like DNA-binding protein